MNHLTITGYLGADPELRYVAATGKQVVSVRVADTPRSFNRESGQWEDGTTLWLRASAWGPLAEYIANSVRKGDRVTLTGRLSQRDYTDPDGAKALCELIEDTLVTVEQWHHQHSTYQHGQAEDLTLGFATFYLNRTNRSATLEARPIGGLAQTGKWGIDARYNKPALTERVQAVAALGERIHVTQLDGVDFLSGLEQSGHQVFVYADPPYVEQGPSLYLHSFSPSDRQRLADHLRGANYPWVLAYDDQPVVRDRLYPWATCTTFASAHTAARQHTGQETIIHSPSLTNTSTTSLP